MDTNKSPSVKNLTTGSVGQKLLFFTLPYLLSYFKVDIASWICVSTCSSPLFSAGRS